MSIKPGDKVWIGERCGWRSGPRNVSAVITTETVDGSSVSYIVDWPDSDHPIRTSRVFLTEAEAKEYAGWYS